jgi:site-specific DNA-methyltransferase (adenine-specific)
MTAISDIKYSPKSEVHLLDCMIGMRDTPDKFYDLAICDPPYGIDINMNMGRRAGKAKAHTDKDWDNQIPDEKYFKELFRVSKNQIIWGGNYFPLPLTKGWIFWDKMVPEGVSFADGELAWTSFDKTLVCFRIKYTGFQGMDDGGKIHPTQKPVALYKKLLKHYADPGFKILDTHLGSGSHRIAAYDMYMDFTAFEIDTEYFNSQEERFKNHISQLKLFTNGAAANFKPTSPQAHEDLFTQTDGPKE